MKKLHHVTILGRGLSVRSSAPPERVRKIEDLVNRKIDEVRAVVGGTDTQTVMILALMNMAEAVLDREEGGCDSSRLADLIRRIEEVTG